jgi:hypothetical protein
MKDIKGFENKYAITEDGRIWSYPKTGQGTNHKGKFLTPRGSGKSGKKKTKRNYQTVALWKNKHGYVYYYIHRLVAETFIPNPKNLPEVNHKNGIKNDNRVENLEWCTSKENHDHATKNGFTTRGTKNSQTKLTVEQVLTIRQLHLQGLSNSHIADIFHVSTSNIWMIVRRKNWNYI